MNQMQSLNRMTTRPLDVPRTMRLRGKRQYTTLPAGKVVPISYCELLREDALKGSRVQVNIEMNETTELLMNAVYVDIKAYLVPWLAFERFQGSMDLFNRSYKGVALEPNAVVPFVETHVKGAHGAEAIYKYLGLHAKVGANVNTMIAEAYNQIWNFRAQNRSKEITQRLLTDKTLAPAFWRHENFAHIVPDFDQAVIDGEVALNVVNAQMAVTGIGYKAAGGGAISSAVGVRETGGGAETYDNAILSTQGTSLYVKGTTNSTATFAPEVFAELADNGITVSLSNIELATKTRAFARMREQYVGHSDEYLIDMLMDGQSIPDQALKQPMLLGQSVNVFGQTKRYSTDADALAASATNGMSTGQMTLRVPRLSTGGVILVTAEITPEQLFERQKDAFFHLGSVDALPEYLRDELDPEKVSVVTNDFVDVDHATPNGTFGYGPLNHEWTGTQYLIGGEAYRPAVNGTNDENRQTFWSVEVANPVLSADFYIATTMNQNPFLDTAADAFRAVTIAQYQIEGNTVFGGLLVEAMNNYDEVMENAPVERIDKE